MRRSSLIAIGLGIWMSAGSALSQEAPSVLPGLFNEVLDVRVINLEVVVTDKKGTPISGLGAEDFRLLVDGEEVEIDYFTEVRGGVALDRGEEARTGTAGIPSLVPGQPVGTNYLVFIDEFFSIARDRDKVLGALARETARLAPEDRMAVVAFDGERLEMLSSWTSSSSALERVFKAAMERPAHGLQRVIDRRQFELVTGADINRLISLSVDNSPDSRGRLPYFSRELYPQERAYVARLSDQLNRSVAAASATLRSFAMPAGRKVMILLSGGWPFIPSDYVVGGLTRMLLSREGPYAAGLYGRLTETANLLGYTLYPVDVPGLDREIPGAETSAPPTEVGGFDRAFVREMGVQTTLDFLARETGGRPLINADRVEVVPIVVEDTRSYYWLGFSPQRDWDDRRHRLEVELTNPEFRTRLRSGFLDSSRSTEVNMALESTLLFGSAPGSGSVEVTVGDAQAATARRIEVPIKVSFALDEITFLPVGDKHVAQLELRFAVLDGQGRQAEIPIVPVALEFDEMPGPNTRGAYETTLLLRKMPHDAVAAVHDPAGGRILTASFRIVP